MSTSTIRIGIIGSGGIAGSHAAAYKTIPGVEIAAVADAIPGKALEFIRKHDLIGTAPFDDYREMLAMDLDGISVCTPNTAHRQPTVDSLNAGKHVLLEKPMSVTLEEGLDMVKASRSSGRMLTIGFQPRYDPNMKLIQEIVRSGKLGKVYYVETGGGRRRGMPGGTFIRKELAGAGAMADIGCYSLDMALNALDYPKPLTVSASTFNHFGRNPLYHAEADKFDVEDFGAAMIRFEGDLTLHFKISWAMHLDSLGTTNFLGTDAGLKITPFGSGNWSGVWDGRVGNIEMFHDFMGGQTSTRIPLVDHQLDLFREKVRDFVDAIREGRGAPIPGEQILIQQAIIDGVIRSAEQRAEVSVEVPDYAGGAPEDQQAEPV
ncbi:MULTISPECIES: Gfo/Idh/MocA family oxidoreductase [unclassified Paenibacillus]|uniref:Gfo/Idh/MocA family protein n=1 Tax=unclassified Paenibacillus TaxID=185978 RepID=UPI0009542296|nr:MULTISPECIES: Gfo/Idh/MocA family oxidoreductase [unclassified Paenibacillus]ASS65013.1 Gfo/Idh/MocA family oxidoreductase [Paenibacillus sp. RUD330]SIQ51472.1 Predicted dehydrogenase [Paenibacillus sp. RU4X]SIQ73780.1 Predicted dehydrogenase [Paenibacillus sp. RU4T]